MRKSGYSIRSSVDIILVALLVALGAPFARGQAMPPGHPPVGPGAAVRSAPMSGPTVVGTVVEAMDASSYTYVRVEAGTRTIWAAAPRFSVKKGDRVSVPTHSPMQNYRSDTLNRTFPLVYFAEKIDVLTGQMAGAMPHPPSMPGAPGMPSGMGDMTIPHPSSPHAVAAPAASFEGIAKAEGGWTIGEVYDEGRELAGQQVSIRGRVVKFTSGVMGTNWLHLQDGTQGKDGENDLVITTDDPAAVGNVVLIHGQLNADRDFGHGYVYKLIVEGADVTVE